MPAAPRLASTAARRSMRASTQAVTQEKKWTLVSKMPAWQTRVNPMQGLPMQGLSMQGLSMQGLPMQGLPTLARLTQVHPMRVSMPASTQAHRPSPTTQAACPARATAARPSSCA
ncbi:MAG: hypothetical protein JNK82_42920 [Myxococcaceae bacterium]|nr:hypothetical protein [Myxococcaceae bacterium]